VKRTVFTTPIVNSVLRLFSVVVMRMLGWKVDGVLPPNGSKSVLIAAPHTSNWDFPYTLMTAFVLGLNIRWMGKSSLFTFPFGGTMRWLGGISVDRSQSTNLVANAAQSLRDSSDPMQLVVPPEGTRSKARYWKTGFYYIAVTAGVPIVMAYMDYPRKRAGLGPVLMPTGDIDQDMIIIKAFYAQHQGKNIDQF
jgi:1-acyl-sn-glycerol-3-phosphate acyltransferase